MPQYPTVSCEECGGNGIDPGSLHVPEDCPSCLGSGCFLAPEVIESIARKHLARAPNMERIDFEERAFRRTG